MRIRVVLVVALTLWSKVALAQNWSFDARAIALGGFGGSGNLSTKMIDEQRDYRSIVLPFGLIQVLKDFNVFDPTSSEFDPVRAVEYAASPIHYIVGRGTTDTGSLFVTDVRNASLSRDLNRYRGFKPANSVLAEGLAAPNWGGTIKVRKDPNGGFQGIYVGAGPYLALHNAATIDQGLTNLLASDTPVTARNATFPITNNSTSQIALAVTGGYRGRFALAGGSGSSRDGLYVAANYNYLSGFRYEDSGMQVRIDTDGAGLVTVRSGVSPIVISRRTSTSGRGFSLDLGVGAVMDRWEVGFGANGIANRIKWTSVRQTTYSLSSLFSGNSNFLEAPTIPVADTQVELPVDYRGSLAFRPEGWSAAAEVGHGFGGTSFHGGIEYLLGRTKLRGGARYTTEKWNPTGGVGFDASRRVSLDVAAFGTSANIERKRQLALAASIRLNRVN